MGQPAEAVQLVSHTLNTEMVRAYHVRNVNEAFHMLMRDTIHEPNETAWREVSSRGMATMEIDGPFITQYLRPCERVLFCPTRDANPFFHFFEALWILDGRDDVEFLARFNSKMAQFSDDGIIFNAPYGQRLRYSFGIDQLIAVIEMLKAKPDTRQAVMAIWNPGIDLRVTSKDLPCNDLLMFKIRDGKLRTTVTCRSNDALLGAYGANVVQFSTLHEFVARAVGVEPGAYYQVSDSFHVYKESPVLAKLIKQGSAYQRFYEDRVVEPYPIMAEGRANYRAWLRDLRYLMMTGFSQVFNVDPFFMHVACPMAEAWWTYKAPMGLKNDRIKRAIDILENQCKASDWRTACIEWMLRRQEVKDEP